MKFVYKYPQAAYPYAQLVEENRRRGRQALEYELLDTGVFEADRYFDVFIEYAKGSPEDLLIRIQVVNRGPETAELDLLPTIWFRNTWAWGYDARRPRLSEGDPSRGAKVIDLEHYHYGQRQLCCEGSPELLFTENDTNARRLYGSDNPSPYVKDGINDCIVHGRKDAVNPEHIGTKAAAHYHLSLGPGETATVRLRFAEMDHQRPRRNPFASDFEEVFAARQHEADEFYATVIPQHLSPDAQSVMRQAFAGLLWSKQFYHYVIEQWLRGDPALPPPPPERRRGRNREWGHLYNDDVISMPDKWEYPWYAAWDLAFHCIPLAVTVHLVEASNTCGALPMSRTIAAYEGRASLLASAVGAHPCCRPRGHPCARDARDGVGDRRPASRGDGPAVDGAAAPRLTHLLAASVERSAAGDRETPAPRAQWASTWWAARSCGADAGAAAG